MINKISSDTWVKEPSSFASSFEKREDAVNFVKSEAEKVSNFILEKKEMENWWGGAAELPGIVQAVAAPYRLIAYTRRYLQKKITPALEIKHSHVVSDLLKLANTVALGLLYAGQVGLVLATTAVLIPLITATGLIISMIEIGIEGYTLHKQNEFLKHVGTAIFSTIDQLRNRRSDMNRPAEGLSLLAKLRKAIVDDHGISLERKNEINKLINAISSNDLDLLESISSLLNNVEKIVLQDRFEQLEKKYFSLSSNEVDSVVKKVENRFSLYESKTRKDEYGIKLGVEAGIISSEVELMHSELSEDNQGSLEYDVKYGIGLIRGQLTKKQIQLANRVQPWLTQKFASSYKELLNAIKAKEEIPGEGMPSINKAKELLTRMEFNAQLKSDSHKHNLALWGLTLLSYVVGCCIPGLILVPLVCFITTLIGATANSVFVNTRLNNEESMTKYAWKNLLPEIPDWMKNLAKRWRKERQVEILTDVTSN